MIELSKRLTKVADMVKRGNMVADVGCDHGYVSIYLMQKEISSKVIALDINKGPLAKAREHFIKYGYSQIETRLSNGIEKIEINEVDTILCAGMGGRLAIDIISSDIEKAMSVEEIILQPQSELEYVRRMLQSMGFNIVKEDIVFEAGKYYPIIKAIPSVLDSRNYENYEYKYGNFLDITNEVYKDFLTSKKIKYEEIVDELSKNAISNEARIEELKEEIKDIERAMKK